MRLLLAAVIGLSALSACAPSRVPYVNPNLPREQAQADYADCRRWADDQVDPSYGADDDRRLDTVVARADRDAAKRRRAEYLRACMESKGYKPGAPR